MTTSELTECHSGLEEALPSVSVVIPHYEDLARLALCLDAIEAQTYPKDRVEIIVADNGSPVGQTAILKVLAGRGKLVTVAERGAGPARNGGVDAASGEVIAFTDCDCLPEPQWLAAGLHALADADLVGGAMKVLVEDRDRMSGEEAFEVEFAFENEKYVKQKGFTVTANLFCRAAMFVEVGGFKVGVSEDYEWCHRAREKGYRLSYGADAIVGHPARRTWAELINKWRRLNTETFQLYAHRGGRGRLRWLLRSALLPASALAHTPRLLMARGVPARAKLGALLVLYRLRLWRCMDAFRLTLKGPS